MSYQPAHDYTPYGRDVPPSQSYGRVIPPSQPYVREAPPGQAYGRDTPFVRDVPQQLPYGGYDRPHIPPHPTTGSYHAAPGSYSGSYGSYGRIDDFDSRRPRGPDRDDERDRDGRGKRGGRRRRRDERRDDRWDDRRLRPVTGPEGVGLLCKLLVPSRIAGPLIGRGGENISRLQDQSHTRIKLSQSKDFYPGTSDRVCVVAGEPKNVIVGIASILAVLDENELEMTKHGISIVRIAIPFQAAGILLGRGGEIVKLLQDECECRISLSHKQDPSTAYGERIVTISDKDDRLPMTATRRILEMMFASPDIYKFEIETSTYQGARTVDIRGPEYDSPVQHDAKLEEFTETAVPDFAAGAIMGKGGSYIKEMQNKTNTKIQLGQRDEFIPGTRDRKVTISGGTEEGRQLVKQMIAERLAEVAHMAPAHTPGPYAPSTPAAIPPAHQASDPSAYFAKPSTDFIAPANAFVAPTNEFVQPSNEFAAPSQEFAAPSQEFAAPSLEFAAASNEFGYGASAGLVSAQNYSSGFVQPDSLFYQPNSHYTSSNQNVLFTKPSTEFE